MEWAALRGGNSHVAEGGSHARLHRHTSRFLFSPALRCGMKFESCWRAISDVSIPLQSALHKPNR